MSFQDAIGRRLVMRRIGEALTGRFEDLRKLSALLNTPVGNPGLAALLRGMQRDIDSHSGLALLFARVGRLASRQAKRVLAGNLIYNWGVKGARRRAEISREGLWAPGFLVLSPTMRCNLKCTGCYSGLYSKEGELAEEDIRRVLNEARRFGGYFAVISGGEPYLLKSMWLRLFREFHDMFFLTYTNGTLLDEATVRELGRLGNVAPAISVEGYREQTDRRRGAGVYEAAEAAMQRLSRHGVIFGISVTYTRENIDVITSEAFVEHWLQRGAIFAWYFMFMPVGKDPLLELVPTPEQRVYCGQRVAELRRKYPIFLADFWNDGPASGGCLAGGRTYLHILNSGKVEPCVFAHFGVDRIQEKSVLEAANSPFFRAIRSEFPYNENGNLRRPCMIIDNPEVLRKVVEEHLVPAGHEHSEDLIRDPEVVAWIDRYAERFRELTDPGWEREIADPASRWYREGKDYKSLFRFRQARESALVMREPLRRSGKPLQRSGRPLRCNGRLQASKYRANSQGCGRRSSAVTSFFSL
jgi:MoaA/NifB/PqqE/SkfB family radical SAM enzyme